MFTISLLAAGGYTIEDDDIAGNGVFVLRRDSDGEILTTFTAQSDLLRILAADGVHLTFNVAESLGTGAVIVGDIDNPSSNPDSITVRSLVSDGAVLLVSDGHILEGGTDAAVDIRASSLVLSAGGRVGASNNAIETQVARLEAESTNGGIFLSNIGNLLIGGGSDQISGLFVHTRGNILLTNQGSITADDLAGWLTRGGSVSGNVTLVANGVDADIVAANAVDSIGAPAGDVVLRAGRDIAVGSGTSSSHNDVRAFDDVIATLDAT
jgi:hypothetical protein